MQGIVYAIGYLVITASVQRGGDVAAAYRSYLAHPAGPRIAALCLLVSGALTTAPTKICTSATLLTHAFEPTHVERGFGHFL